MSRHAQRGLATNRQDGRQDLPASAGQALPLQGGRRAAPAEKPVGAITYTITKGADVWSLLPHWARKQAG